MAPADPNTGPASRSDRKASVWPSPKQMLCDPGPGLINFAESGQVADQVP